MLKRPDDFSVRSMCVMVYLISARAVSKAGACALVLLDGLPFPQRRCARSTWSIAPRMVGAGPASRPQ